MKNIPRRSQDYSKSPVAAHFIIRSVRELSRKKRVVAHYRQMTHPHRKTGVGCDVCAATTAKVEGSAGRGKSGGDWELVFKLGVGCAERHPLCHLPLLSVWFFFLICRTILNRSIMRVLGVGCWCWVAVAARGTGPAAAAAATLDHKQLKIQFKQPGHSVD